MTLASEVQIGHVSISYGKVTEVTQKDNRITVKFDSNAKMVYDPEEVVK